MVGVDVSLHPWTWAAPHAGRWVFGTLPDGPEPAAGFRRALAEQGIRERTIALCVPTRSVVWETLPGLRGKSQRARKAAVLAAATTLRVSPHETVVSIDQAEDGLMYACAERAAVETLMAPWIAAGFKVQVIEPAAISLLRGVGTAEPSVIVRAGAGEVEIVAGSMNRLMLARHLPGSWDGREGGLRLEVDATIDTARKEGAAIQRVLLSAPADLASLIDAFSGKAALAALAPEYRLPDTPSWSIAAVSAALWTAGPARGTRAPGVSAASSVLTLLAAIAGHRAHGRARHAA